ncbi:MAG: hypothetical protein CMP08_01935 [Xanthomonadales bacterium]|nr:hypothetical protein [Xanthomonadales bacterium]
MAAARPLGAPRKRSLTGALVRTVLAGGLALAVVFVGLPWLVGQQLEARLHDTLEQAADEAGLRLADWRLARGVRETHIEARLVAETCRRACTAARLRGRLLHGPLWADRAGFALGLAKLTGQLAHEAGRNAPALPGLPALRVAATADLLGAGRMTIRIPAFETAVVRAPGAGSQAAMPRLAGAPSRAELAFTDFGRRPGAWHLVVPRLVRSGATAGQISVRGLTARGDIQAHRLVMHLQRVVVDNGRGQATRIGDLRASLMPADAGRRRLVVDADRVLLPNNENAALTLEAVGNRDAFIAGPRLVAGWRARGGLAGGALNQPDFYAETVARALAATDLEARMSLVAGDERLAARLKLAAPADLGGPTNAVDVLSALNLQARVGLSRHWLRRLAARARPPAAIDDTERAIDRTIERLVARALVVPAGPAYATSRARLEDGRLVINGRARPEWRSIVLQLQAAAPGL